jgi:hypothetical protein
MLTFAVNINLEIIHYLLSGGNPENPAAALETREKLTKFNLTTFTDEELLDICLL